MIWIHVSEIMRRETICLFLEILHVGVDGQLLISVFK